MKNGRLAEALLQTAGLVLAVVTSFVAGMNLGSKTADGVHPTTAGLFILACLVVIFAALRKAAPHERVQRGAFLVVIAIACCCLGMIIAPIREGAAQAARGSTGAP